MLGRKIGFIGGWLILLLVLAMPVQARNWGGLEYREEPDGTVTVTGADWNMWEIVIPGTIDGKKVTAIGDSAFASHNNLGKVVLPEGLITIGDFAFYKSNLETLRLPDSVVSIGSNAFYLCDSLTEIVLPAGIQKIGINGFGRCTALKAVTFQGDVGSLEDQAFYNCESLETVTFRGNVGSVGNDVFGETLWLENRQKDNPLVCVGDIVIDGRTCTGTVAIPEGTKEIAAGAFKFCTVLEKVTLPAGLSAIGEMAFSGCKSLATVALPGSLSSIGQDAFANTAWLKAKQEESGNGLVRVNGILIDGSTCTGQISVPAGIEAVAGGAFYECTGLTKITLPGSVEKIGEGAFYGCTSLTEITVPAGVSEIGAHAFGGCRNLETVTMYPGLKTIGEAAFYGCTSLTAARLPSGLETVGKSAFNDCTGLKTVELPDGLAALGSWTFHGCTGLTHVSVPGSIPAIEERTFSGCSKLETVILAEGLGRIGPEAFNGCTALTGITVPEGVVSIEENVFKGCTALAALKLPDSLADLGENVFEGCSALTEIRLPAGLKEISPVVFCGCTALQTVYIPDGVETVGAAAFKDCTALTAITIPASVQSLCVRNSADAVFEGSGLRTVRGADGSFAQFWAERFGYTFEKTGESVRKPTEDPEPDSPLANPQMAENTSLASGQGVVWDSVLFGSYPQAEVVTEAMKQNYTALDSTALAEGDLVVADSLYGQLESAEDWDSHDEITLEGVRYRRIKKENAVYAEGASGYYVWADMPVYHYFRYEPIRWRVLSVEGGRALLLADKVLDNQVYNPYWTNGGWKTSAVRSWLNGYGAASNYGGQDYTRDNFIDRAFSGQEQAAIAECLVANGCNAEYGISAGEETRDKLFFLSDREVYYTDAAARYGFSRDRDVQDEARQCKSSTYAKAMGSWAGLKEPNTAKCSWLLRSLGDNHAYVGNVIANGSVNWVGNSVDVTKNRGVRPALYLDVAAAEQYTYAGIACSDGVERVSIKDCTVTVADTVYTGSPLSPPVTVTKDGVVLKEGEAYTLGYADNTEAGTSTVTVTGLGSYGGTVVKSFTIAKAGQSVSASISPSGIQVGQTARVTASGIGAISYRSGNTAVAAVDSGGVVTGLSQGTAVITISAAGDANHSAASKDVTVTVTQNGGNAGNGNGGNGGGTTPGGNGGGNGSGTTPGGNGQGAASQAQTIRVSSKTVAYKSKPFSLKAKASGDGKLTYKSSNKKVATVSSKGKVTVKGYGKATITVRAAAKGNYKAATKKITIQVVPKTSVLKKASSPGKKGISAFWSKDKTVDGYQMYICLRKDFKKGAYERTFKKTVGSMKLTGLKSGKTYYIRLRSYKKVGKKKFYSKWSKVKSVKVK